ncbi:amidohydrolase family protein [Rhodococcus opacus]|nr:amidohydrolase family protein [Rhodococcus opacus]
MAQPVVGRIRPADPRLPADVHVLSEKSAAGYVAEAIRVGHARLQVPHPGGAVLTQRSAPRSRVGCAAGVGCPTVIHCGSGPAPGTYTGPEPIAELLSRYPRLHLIIAHMGLPEYRKFLDLAGKYPNVYLDTTMAFTDYTEAATPFPRDEVHRLSDLQERIVFGSDFPNIPYPYLDALEVSPDSISVSRGCGRSATTHAARLFAID